jgi:hypothetical protein
MHSAPPPTLIIEIVPPVTGVQFATSPYPGWYVVPPLTDIVPL